MADQPQREEETNCREQGSCMSGQLQREEETNCREQGELHVRSASGRGGDQLQEGRGGLYVRSASERGGDQLQGRGGLYVRSASERGELCDDPPAAGSKNCFVPASNQLSSSDWTVVKRLVVGRALHL